MQNSMAYTEGYVAFEDTEGEVINPYSRGTKEHREWNRGWYQALDDEDVLEDVEENYG